MNRTYKHRLILAGLLLVSLFVSSTAIAKEEILPNFSLKDGQTVLFLGDSITYGDMYIQYLDAFLYTQYPDWHVSLINRGIPSETCAGTSEPTHDPPRPDVHIRLDRTLESVKPDLVFICYGMNDGIYHSPNAGILEKYKTGMTRLVNRVREATDATVIILTPPPFDYRPFAKKQKPADQAEPDYRFPAEDYDDTLASFAAWLMTQREEGLKVQVIDLHTALSNILKERRKTDNDFRLAGDGIHPGPTGHWLMARAILCAIHAIPNAKITVHQMRTAVKSKLVTSDNQLPLPLDPRLDQEIVSLAKESKDFSGITPYLNQPLFVPIPRKVYPNHLSVLGLRRSQTYELQSAGKTFGTAASEELLEGVDLTSYPEFPLNKTSQEVLKLVQQRRQILRDVWIMSDPSPRLASEQERLLKTSKSTAEQATELDAKIRELCQPVDLNLTILLKGEK